MNNLKFHFNMILPESYHTTLTLIISTRCSYSNVSNNECPSPRTSVELVSVRLTSITYHITASIVQSLTEAFTYGQKICTISTRLTLACGQLRRSQCCTVSYSKDRYLNTGFKYHLNTLVLYSSSYRRCNLVLSFYYFQEGEEIL